MANKKPIKLEAGRLEQFAATDTIAPADGGTGLGAVGAANRILGANAAANALEYKALAAGANITITHAAEQITIAASGGGGGTFPKFSAYQSSSQSLSAATSTKIIFQTEEFDTNTNFASSRFTPTVSGYYQISAGLETDSTSASYLYLYKNGAVYKVLDAGVIGLAYGSALVFCNGSTDYIEIYAYHDTACNTTNIADATYFQGFLVS